MSRYRKPVVDLGESLPLVPPLYQSSVYTLPDLEALDRLIRLNVTAVTRLAGAPAVWLIGPLGRSFPPASATGYRHVQGQGALRRA